jgi:hypothetical protein
MIDKSIKQSAKITMVANPTTMPAIANLQGLELNLCRKHVKCWLSIGKPSIMLLWVLTSKN